MRKILLKMDVSEIIAGSFCIGLLVAFVMIVFHYMTANPIFAMLAYVLPVVIISLTLCVLMCILLICAAWLKRRGKR